MFTVTRNRRSTYDAALARPGFLATLIASFAVIILIQVVSSAIAEDRIKQIKLTEEQVKAFIAGKRRSDDIAANIYMVMAGIDPQSKTFTEPRVAIQKEIDELTNDKSIPEREKGQMLNELKASLKSTQPIQYPGNVELVKKYYDQIDASLAR